MIKANILKRLERRDDEININMHVNSEYDNYVQFCLDYKGPLSPSFNEKQFHIIKNYILNTYCNNNQ